MFSAFLVHVVFALNSMTLKDPEVSAYISRIRCLQIFPREIESFGYICSAQKMLVTSNNCLIWLHYK